MPYTHIHLWYVLLAIIFASIISYMFLYGKRSKDRQNRIGGNRTPASKEAGIAEAQESLKQERRRKQG